MKKINKISLEQLKEDSVMHILIKAELDAIMGGGTEGYFNTLSTLIYGLSEGAHNISTSTIISSYIAFCNNLSSPLNYEGSEVVVSSDLAQLYFNHTFESENVSFSALADMTEPFIAYGELIVGSDENGLTTHAVTIFGCSASGVHYFDSITGIEGVRPASEFLSSATQIATGIENLPEDGDPFGPIT